MSTLSNFDHNTTESIELFLNMPTILLLVMTVFTVACALYALSCNIYSTLFFSKNLLKQKDFDLVNSLITNQRNRYHRLILNPEYVKRSKPEGIYKIATRLIFLITLPSIFTRLICFVSFLKQLSKKLFVTVVNKRRWCCCYAQ